MGDRDEWLIKRTGDWDWPYKVVHVNGGLIGRTFTLWGAKRLIRREKRMLAAALEPPVYRESAD